MDVDELGEANKHAMCNRFRYHRSLESAIVD